MVHVSVCILSAKPLDSDCQTTPEQGMCASESGTRLAQGQTQQFFKGGGGGGGGGTPLSRFVYWYQLSQATELNWSVTLHACSYIFSQAQQLLVHIVIH